MSDNKIPTLDIMKGISVETLPFNTELAYLKEDVEEYVKEVVKYTLEQAAKKGRVNVGGVYKSSDGHLVSKPSRIDKKSVLSLEEQIIKDLNL